MPRVYKPNPRSKKYKKYDEALIIEAVEEYKKTGNSLKMVAEKFNIDKSVLYRHCTRTMKKQGGQTVLSEDTELKIIKYINICAEWGYPLDALDLRYLVKYYLDKAGRTIPNFKENLPGPDFVSSFLKRHKSKISQRNSQNIKRNRAAISPDIIKEYFSQLKVSLADIDSKNIINYDETNLKDDPGRKKILTKRGTKYPERVMNHSKGAVSIMMAATATGELLPPYVVYKAQNLYDTWSLNGPPVTRYNRTQSGWFDAAMFEDWIKSIILPYFQNKEGKKCLIGDNLSSHLSVDVIKLCQEKNIFFVFLPTNSTHLTQPLDVAFFRPMKIAWRNIILKWKKTDGKSQASIPKGCFPKLLKKLIEELSTNAKESIISGFRKTGIMPVNEDQVLSRLPVDSTDDDKEAVEKSVLDILREMRYGTMNIEEPKRKKKINVIPGKSIGSEIEDYLDSPDEENKPTKKKKSNLSKCKKIKKRNEKINKIKKDVMIDEQNLNESFNLNCQELDVETMPILYEDILLCGEEVSSLPEQDLQPSLNIDEDKKLELADRQDLESNLLHSTSVNHNSSEQESNNIKILANEVFDSDITIKNKINLKKCIRINANCPVKISKSYFINDKPSTSGMNVTTSRRSSYYKNDSAIYKDLMDDTIE